MKKWKWFVAAAAIATGIVAANHQAVARAFAPHRAEIRGVVMTREWVPQHTSTRLMAGKSLLFQDQVPAHGVVELREAGGTATTRYWADEAVFQRVPAVQRHGQFVVERGPTTRSTILDAANVSPAP